MFRLNEKEDLYEQLNNNDIYIYGAGKAGTLIALLLKEVGVIPRAFFVTAKDESLCNWMGFHVEVFEAGKIKANDKVVIAALGDNQKEIIKKCVSVEKKYVITEVLYKKYYPQYMEHIQRVFVEHKQTLYRRNNGEERLYKTAFNNVVENNADFKERFYKLTLGLDEDSKEILERCVERIRILKQSTEQQFDFFSNGEKEKILICQQFIKDNLKQISENVWSLNENMLPVNDFRGEIFYDNLGVEKISNIDYCKEKDIIDVGGYIGDSALVLSKLTTQKIHVFEPIKSSIELMKRTRELNEVNIKENLAAVSSEDKKMNLAVGESEYLSGLTKIGERTYTKQIMVDGVTIDKYVESNNVKVGLIKVHAEGAEQDVIKGAEKTIREQSPILIIEINHTESDFFDIKPMLEQINPNYKFKIFKPSNKFMCLGIKLIAEVY